jgi:hypothetical protein
MQDREVCEQSGRLTEGNSDAQGRFLYAVPVKRATLFWVGVQRQQTSDIPALEIHRYSTLGCAENFGP